MKVNHYTQVLLTQVVTGGGFYFHTCWIPSTKAILGKRLNIDTLGGTWTVTERYETLPAQVVESREDDYKHQREVSDI